MALNRILLVIAVAITSCNGSNPNGNNSGQNDTATLSAAPNNTAPAASPADSTGGLSQVKVDNLDCPVCRKSVDKCLQDTTSYMGKLVGFDSKQCQVEFLGDPTKYKLDSK